MSTSVTRAPVGQISCLLCRGFVSVMDGDRARFVDHVHSEHEVRHDQDVLLAVSVLTQREKLFLIKTTAARLEAIGKGREPDLSKSILGGLAQSPAQRGGPRGGVRPGAGAPVVVKPGIPNATLTPQSVQTLTSSRFLSSNTSISISKVDMTRPCNMCQVMLPSPEALVDHMNKNHFRGLAGLNIVSGDGSSPRPAPPRSVSSPLSQTPTPTSRPQSQARTPVLNATQTQRNISLTRTSTPGQKPPVATLQAKPQSQTPTSRRQSTSSTRTPQQKRSRTPAGSTPKQQNNKGGVKVNQAQGGAGVNKLPVPVSKEGQQETVVRKEAEGLQTHELLDNLVNFLNDS